MLPIELFGPLAISYVGLKLYEDFVLDGIHMLPTYGNILVKIIPVVALLIWVLASDIVEEKYQLRLGLALVFSLGGDILLELNHLKHHFMLGLASFLIAHIFYAWTFWGKPSLSILNIAGSLVVTGAILALGSTFGEAAPADLALPVMAYCVVIGFMAVLSILCSKVPRRGLAIAGTKWLRVLLRSLKKYMYASF